MSTTEISRNSLPTNYLAPSGREEAWRFSPMPKINPLLQSDVELISYHCEKDLFFNTESKLPQGVSISQELLTAISKTQDESTVNLRNIISKVSVLNIDSNIELNTPIYIKRNLSGHKFGSRLLVKVGKFSHLTLVIQSQGDGQLLEEIEFDLQDGSNLKVIHLQEWDSSAVHLGHIHARIGRDATLTSHVITVGGSVVRLLPTIDLAGEGSHVEMNGVYFATAGQHLEHRIHVDHNISKAKSRVNYKGALAGESARTVWIGDVYIHAGANDTDTYELNRNLLLTDGARADSVPNLEIETGEIVGAGHASTTGKFDDEQLFYLMSRGIPMDVARKLVIRGYFAELISLLGIQDIQDRISERIEIELEKVGI